jgi:pSer/pThr/pTyr-binding forkhead associated (FHA) protein
MPVRLQVNAGAASADGSKPPPQELKLDADEILIGRDKTCTVVLTEPSVSRNHARISREGSLYFLEDVGSAYGTRVNGQALPKGEKRLLRNGDVIAVGTFDVTFTRLLEVSSPGPGDGREGTAAMARAVMKDVMRGMSNGSAPHLIVLNGPHKDDKHDVVEAKELVVGRADECHIVFADDLTSRKHAKIRRDWSGTHVEDLGSRNGVKVNQKLIKGPVTLKDRDEVEIGGTRMLYVDPSEMREAPFVPPQTDPGIALEPDAPPPPPRVPKKRIPVEEPPSPVEPIIDPPPPEEEPPPPEEEPPEELAEPLSAELREANDAPPGGLPAQMRARLSAIPRDAQTIKRVLPLVIVGVVVLVGLGVLIALLVGV